MDKYKNAVLQSLRNINRRKVSRMSSE